MAPLAPLVALLTQERAPEAARVLADAFDDDPLFAYLWPDPTHRHRTMLSIQRQQAVVAAQLGTGHVALDPSTGEALGASLWLEPGMKKTVMQNLREVWSVWPTLLYPRTIVTAARIFLEVDKKHPKEPHWYLEVLAVGPAAQGRGVGGDLIDVGLRAADRQGLITYLETSKEANLAWYGRFGFEVVDTVQPVAAAPPAWTMVRQPRDPA